MILTLCRRSALVEAFPVLFNPGSHFFKAIYQGCFSRLDVFDVDPARIFIYLPAPNQERTVASDHYALRKRKANFALTRMYQRFLYSN
jgi:hypothetical protein